jgi:tRNA-uridine 2-sulfurtransferase
MPVFVTGIDASSNTVMVGDRDELMVGGLLCEEATFVAEPPAVGTEVLVQHRSHGTASPAEVVACDEDSFEIAYRAPVEAIAPGQSAVLYSKDDTEVLGGGIITSTNREGAGV